MRYHQGWNQYFWLGWIWTRMPFYQIFHPQRRIYLAFIAWYEKAKNRGCCQNCWKYSLQKQTLLRNTSMTHSMSSDRQSLLLLSLLQMSRILKILIFQLSYVLYFVNFIHTIKISNLQFCVVITSSLFWPKNVNYWLCERRGPFSSCIETCMFSYISLLI